MTIASWIKEMLDERAVAYEELHHPEAFTALEVAEREHTSGHYVAKVVIVLADDKPVELVLPASRHVSLERVRDILGANEVRLATEEENDRFFTDCETGAVPPLRHWRNVEVLMDESMRIDGDIVFQAGTHCDALRMRFEDWFKLVNPRTGRFGVTAEPVARVARREDADPMGEGALADAALRKFLGTLLTALQDQAHELERLSTHVERHTDRLLSPSRIPLVISELSALQAQLELAGHLPETGEKEEP